MTEMQNYQQQQNNNHSYLTQTVVGDSSEFAVLQRDGNDSNPEIPIVAVVKPRTIFSCSVFIPSEVYVLWNISGKNATGGIPSAGKTQFGAFHQRVSHLVSRNAITYNCPVQECPTKDNVMVQVNCTINFKITSPSDFVLKLGAARADDLLRGSMEEAVRKLVRTENVAQVRGIRGAGSSEKLLEALRKKFLGCGVDFASLKITEVTLPSNMQNALEATTEMNAKLKTIEKQHDVKKAETETRLINELKELQRKNLQEEQVKQGELQQAKVFGDTAKTNMTEEANTQTAGAMVQVEVMKRNAQAEKERAANNAERNRAQQLNKAKNEAQQIKLKADEDLRRGVMDSVEERAVAEREAQAIKLDAEVENKLKEQVALQRKHELALAQRKVLATLAAKGHYNLVGKTGDVMLKSMMEGDFNESDFGALRG